MERQHGAFGRLLHRQIVLGSLPAGGLLRVAGRALGTSHVLRGPVGRSSQGGPEAGSRQENWNDRSHHGKEMCRTGCSATPRPVGWRPYGTGCDRPMGMGCFQQCFVTSPKDSSASPPPRPPTMRHCPTVSGKLRNRPKADAAPRWFCRPSARGESLQAEGIESTRPGESADPTWRHAGIGSGECKQSRIGAMPPVPGGSRQVPRWVCTAAADRPRRCSTSSCRSTWRPSSPSARRARARAFAGTWNGISPSTSIAEFWPEVLRGRAAKDCGEDFLIAFSCKARGACPSCNTRRMVEIAAHLSEAALLQVQERVRRRCSKPSCVGGCWRRARATRCSPGGMAGACRWMPRCAAPPISPCRGPPHWKMFDQTVEIDPIHPEPEYDFDQRVSWYTIPRLIPDPSSRGSGTPSLRRKRCRSPHSALRLRLACHSTASMIVFHRAPTGFGAFPRPGRARLPPPYVENTR